MIYFQIVLVRNANIIWKHKCEQYLIDKNMNRNGGNKDLKPFVITDDSRK